MQEEQTYEYRVCDFCLTPPCEDCLPWDFATFNLSEIPLFFPDAVVNENGSLDVHKHRNCRCTLFPISGYMMEENVETSTLSDDMKAKIEAIRNHKLAFSNENKSQFYLQQARYLMQQETVKQTADKTKQTVFKLEKNNIVKSTEQTSSQAEQEQKEQNDKYILSRQSEKTRKEQEMLDKHVGYEEKAPATFKEAPGVAVTKKAPAETLTSKTMPLQVVLGSNEQSILKLAVEQTLKHKEDTEINLFAGRSRAQLVRLLYAMRSPKAAMRAGARVGIQMMRPELATGAAAGAATGKAAGEATGMTELASAMTPMIVPLVFFMAIPLITKLTKALFQSQLQQQMQKALVQWDKQREQAYREIYRGLGVQS